MKLPVELPFSPIRRGISSWIQRNVFPFFGLFVWYLVVLIVVLLVFRFLGDLLGDQSKVLQDLNPDESKILVPVIAAVAALLVATVRFAGDRESRRRAFVLEHASKIFSDAKLLDTYYDLVYSYHGATFRSVERKVGPLLAENMERVDEIFATYEEWRTACNNAMKKKKQQDLDCLAIKLAGLQDRMFEELAHLQGGRKEGSRFYHPRLFRGSIEERRLDSLLGFLNIIAYYYVCEPHLVKKSDMDASIAYVLRSTVNSAVVSNYIDFVKMIHEKERKAGIHKNNIDGFRIIGQKNPFRYLIEIQDFV